MKNAGNERPILIFPTLTIILFSCMALEITFASQVTKDAQLPLETSDGNTTSS